MIEFNFESFKRAVDICSTVSSTRALFNTNAQFAFIKHQGEVYAYMDDGALAVMVNTECNTDSDELFIALPCKEVQSVIDKFTGLSRTCVDKITFDEDSRGAGYYMHVYEKPLVEDGGADSVSQLYLNQCSDFKITKATIEKDTVIAGINKLNGEGTYTTVNVEEFNNYIDTLSYPAVKAKYGSNIVFCGDNVYTVVANALGIKLVNGLKDVIKNTSFVVEYGVAISSILKLTMDTVDILENNIEVEVKNNFVNNTVNNSELYFKNNMIRMRYLSTNNINPAELSKFNYKFDSKIMLDKPYLQDVLRRVDGDELFVDISFDENNPKETRCVLQTHIGKFNIPVMDAIGSGKISMFIPVNMFQSLIMNHIKYDINTDGGESVCVIGLDRTAETDSYLPLGALSGTKAWISVYPRVFKQSIPQF